MRFYGVAVTEKQADPYGRGLNKDEAPRCWRCKKMLAVSVTRPWTIICPRCKARNAA